MLEKAGISIQKQKKLNWWYVMHGVIFGFIFIKGAVRMLFFPFHPDTTWLTYVTEQILIGRQPYVDIVDLNSPYIYLFNIPAILAGYILPFSSLEMFRVWTLVVVGLFLGLTFYILRQIFIKDRNLITFIMTWLTYVFFMSYLENGQREYILVALVLPYLCCSIASIHNININKWLRMIVGVSAGFGIFLKPQFILIIVSVYLLIWVRSKKWIPKIRLEDLGFMGMAVIFGLVLVVWVPDYFRIIQLAARNYYQIGVGLNMLLPELIYVSKIVLIPVFAVMIYLLKMSEVKKTFATVMILATTMSCLVGIFQAKGFLYHFYPMLVLEGLVIIVIINESLLKLFKIFTWKWLHYYVNGVIVFSIITIVMVTPKMDYMELPNADLFYKSMMEYAKNKSIATFTTEIFPLFPSANLVNADIVTPYHILWPLPGEYYPNEIKEKPFPYHSVDEMTIIEQQLFDNTIEALIKYQPETLIVEVDSGKYGFGETSFDYIEYFSQDPRFVEFLDAYEQGEVVSGYHQFYLLKK